MNCLGHILMDAIVLCADGGECGADQPHYRAAAAAWFMWRRQPTGQSIKFQLIAPVQLVDDGDDANRADAIYTNEKRGDRGRYLDSLVAG